MLDLTFRCFNCKKVSSAARPAQEREVMDRLRDLGQDERRISFYCEHCGTANEIPLTEEATLQLLFRR